MDEFKKRHVEVVGVSIDSQFVHHAWRNTPIEKGGIGQLNYPLVADIDHSICRAYGVEHPEAAPGDSGESPG
jgi:peroxiredoxin (alkyl hydroperoxide reductase subunit C)